MPGGITVLSIHFIFTVVIGTIFYVLFVIIYVLCLHFRIIDCAEPTTTGYSYLNGTGTTYGETYNTACATGYIGTAYPAQVICRADGNWTDISGCAILSKGSLCFSA